MGICSSELPDYLAQTEALLNFARYKLSVHFNEPEDVSQMLLNRAFEKIQKAANRGDKMLLFLPDILKKEFLAIQATLSAR